jgi:Protein of unknown function (DUF3096)
LTMQRSRVFLAGLLVAAALLSGCVVEAPGHYHWWGWHHDER